MFLSCCLLFPLSPEGLQRGRHGLGARLPPAPAAVVPHEGLEDGARGAVLTHTLPFVRDLQDAPVQRGPAQGNAQRRPGTGYHTVYHGYGICFSSFSFSGSTHALPLDGAIRVQPFLICDPGTVYTWKYNARLRPQLTSRTTIIIL